jgi:hypothetical protein
MDCRLPPWRQKQEHREGGAPEIAVFLAEKAKNSFFDFAAPRSE